MQKIIYMDECSSLIKSKPVNGGNCSKIYQIDNTTYFKHLNEDYRDLKDSLNIELLELLIVISNLENTSHLIKPETIIKSETLLHGYTTKIIPANKLGDTSKKTIINDLINSIDRVKKDITKLSLERINTEDVNYENILYDGELYLLDFDLGMIDKFASTEALYLKTMFNIFDSILYVMVRGNSDNPLLNDYALASLYTKLHDLKSDDYKAYYNKLIEMLENKMNTKINTVGQMRHSLRKTNMVL